MWEKWK